MNILIISPAIYPCAIGGVEIFNYYFTKELARRGHEVWVLTSCGHDWNSRNIRLVRLNERFLPNRTLSTGFHLSLKLMKLKREVDVVHVPYTSNSPLVYPIVLAKIIADIHYIIYIMGGGMYPWKPKTLQRSLFRHADAIVAVSETLSKEYEKRSGRRIKVIPPLIPFGKSKISKEQLRRKYGLSKDDKVVLSLGSIKRIKGSDTLLYAFLGLGRSYVEKYNLKLLYAGGGPMKPMLARKVKESNFDRHVRFLGVVPHKEVRHIYRLADIYVIPSLFEGAPLSLLEAMFNGLPIIGADVDGINSLVKHEKNGLLFQRKNTEDLIGKIRQLVENNGLVARLADAAKEDYLRNYRFEHAFSQYTQLCIECAKKND